jgi:hypothetical protein
VYLSWVSLQILVVHLRHSHYKCWSNVICVYCVRYRTRLLQSSKPFCGVSHLSKSSSFIYIKRFLPKILKYTICEILKSLCFIICIVCVSVIATCVCNIHTDFRHNVFYMSVKPTCNRNAGDLNFFPFESRFCYIQVLEGWQSSVLQFLHRHHSFTTEFIKHKLMSLSETF